MSPLEDRWLDEEAGPGGRPGAPVRPRGRWQRWLLVLRGADAERVAATLAADASGAAGTSGGAIEEVALIAGDNGFVYSIALRCAPADLPRLDPVFEQAARSWRLQPSASAAAPKAELWDPLAKLLLP